MVITAKVLRQVATFTKPKGTPTIASLFAKQASPQSARPLAATAEVIQQQKGTRYFKVFPVKKLLSFTAFLRGLDGGRKKESEARQITADLNNLKFATPKVENPVWLDLLDAAKVSDYRQSWISLSTVYDTSACSWPQKIWN